MHVAKKTLALIEETMQADQGASFRGWLEQVIPHVGDAYSTDQFPFRSHLGASLIGGDCARQIFYSFHWATNTKHGGRMLRLFNRGHLEEARFIALLLMIGCEVYQQDENGNQFRVSGVEGHFGGSGDGVIVNVPDVEPGVPLLGEFKTSAEKKFLEIKAKGLRVVKPEHYVQMQIYMSKMGYAGALYMIVNKNTDEIHAEIVTLDTNTANHYSQRAETIVWAHEPPAKIHESPGWWKCKFCDERPVCKLNAEPHRNCRTCKHSMPAPNKEWVCNNQMDTPALSKDEQLAACINYERGF